MSSESSSFDLASSELSETQFQTLCTQLDPTLLMLDALCHRNKNQHRHSSWWRNVCILRRSIRRLLDDDPVKLRLDRVSWLAAHILPSSYMAFSQLLTDSQFAQLGISLIAMLSAVYEALRPLLRGCASDDRAHASSYHSMTADDAADINICDMGIVIVRRSDSISLSIEDSNDRSTKLFNCNDEGSNSTLSKTIFGHEKDTADFGDIFKAAQKPLQITKDPLLTMDDKFGQQTSVSKKSKSRSSSHRDTSGTQIPAERKTKQEKRDSRVGFDDIFEFVSVSKPNKKRTVSSEDVIAPKSSKKKKEKIDKASETLGFDDIFGDLSKKDKKKTKSGKKSDISDIFTGL